MILQETYQTLYNIYCSINGNDILSFEEFIRQEQNKRDRLLNKISNKEITAQNKIKIGQAPVKRK